jgi:hypothetical protein
MKVLRHPETDDAIWLEAQPVLDLLERVYLRRHEGRSDDPLPEIVALLRAHGRLKEQEMSDEIAARYIAVEEYAGAFTVYKLGGWHDPIRTGLREADALALVAELEESKR